jgi:hypothetical protein
VSGLLNSILVSRGKVFVVIRESPEFGGEILRSLHIALVYLIRDRSIKPLVSIHTVL